ncbi:MAG: hypothetical protein JKX76_01940 [Colwellia sp.]|nr:hypothetical protein [Colwellia sp.]
MVQIDKNEKFKLDLYF